ncbi:MAG: hypothetical protein ACSLE9_07875 [Burkholderiaceae bacterium]
MPYYEVTTKFVLKGEKTVWVEARSTNHARGIVQRMHRGEEALDLEGEPPIPITTEYTAGPPPRITGVFISTTDRKGAEGCREA